MAKNELMVIANNNRDSERKYFDMWAKMCVKEQMASMCRCNIMLMAYMAAVSEACK